MTVKTYEITLDSYNVEMAVRELLQEHGITSLDHVYIADVDIRVQIAISHELRYKYVFVDNNGQLEHAINLQKEDYEKWL